MSDLRSGRSTRDWRAKLTGEEKRRLAAIEREIGTLSKRADMLRMERNRIQNRATVRAGK